MVNGPRPTTITASPAPAAGRGPATPTVLTRQHTSIYSTASTTTPVLVYGKEVTPLAGAWADEPWSPKECRANPVGLMEVLEAPVTHAPMDDGECSRTETAAFDEEAHEATTGDAAVGMFRTASDSTTATSQAATTAATMGHVSFVFRYDPYSVHNRTEMYRCTCDDCIDRANTVSGVDVLAAPIYTNGFLASETASMGHPMASYETFEQQPSMPAYDSDAMWASAVPEAMAVEMAPTAFMPPPPPPRITRRVISESAEASLDAESAFYLIVMRWYDKISRAQVQWIMNDDHCPEPHLEKYSFDEWVDEIGRWWLRNFEHVQVKTTASSGAIRAAASTVRRPTGAFETHTSGPRPFQPRRQLGTSGLTAEMLDSHNQLVAPQGNANRSRRELPW